MRLRILALTILAACDPAPAPSARACIPVAEDEFCAVFDDLTKAGGYAAPELADACAADQPPCDLCLHARSYCAVAGYPDEFCDLDLTACNCLAGCDAPTCETPPSSLGAASTAAPSVEPTTLIVEAPSADGPLKVLRGCLDSTERPTTVTVEIKNFPDDDDMQPFTVTIESSAHEDAVSCILNNIAGFPP